MVVFILVFYKQKEEKQMVKPKPFVIKTPFPVPTIEKLSKLFGVSKKEIKEIKKMIDEIFEKSKKRKRKSIKGVNREGNR